MDEVAKVFRVFISSTFSDMKQERGILQRDAFPRLERYCEKHGARFQAVDLRWGVSEEAALNHKTLQICLNEIERCQSISPQPNFLILLGQKYGWQPVPASVPETEMICILKQVNSEDDKFLRSWYRRDDNAVPPVYVLMPRTGEYADYGVWETVERKIHCILEMAVGELELGKFRKEKYFASATHQEIIVGALDSNINSADRVLACFRTIHNLPNDDSTKDYFDFSSDGLNNQAAYRLAHLKEELKRRLNPANVISYSGEWSNGTLDFADHLHDFNEQVYAHLEGVILSQLESAGELNMDSDEVRSHSDFRVRATKHFQGRHDVLEKIERYLFDVADNNILALIGDTGTGKSSIMAQSSVLAEAARWTSVFRFIGVTTKSTDVISLLRGICWQIADEYNSLQAMLGEEDPAEAFDLQGIKKLLYKCLLLAKQSKPLVLYIDALDLLAGEDRLSLLTCMPRELPPNTKIIVSWITGELESWEGMNKVQIPMLPELVARKILQAWLDDAKRTLTNKQFNLIVTNFNHSKSALYLNIAFLQAKKWHSYDSYSLRNDVSGIINDLIDVLEKDLPSGFVRTAISYILSGRFQGLTENELLEVLAFDEEYWKVFLTSSHPDHRQEIIAHRNGMQSLGKDTLSGMKIPVSVWSRLFFELGPYLSERSAGGIPIIVFYHMQFCEILRKRYGLSNTKSNSGVSQTDVQNTYHHKVLAKYFDAQTSFPEPASAQKEKLLTFPYQPRLVNRRKTDELVYQIMQTADWDWAERVFLDFSYLEAKVESGAIHELIKELQLLLKRISKQSPTFHVFKHIAEALLRDQNFIDRHVCDYPQALFQCLFNSCWWFDSPSYCKSHHIKLYDPAVLLSDILEKWLIEKTNEHQGFRWLRSLRPPNLRLGSSQKVVLRGHTAPVIAIRYTQDSEFIISGSSDMQVIVWNAITGKEIRRFTGHSSEVFYLHCCNDAKRVISASRDGNIRFWSLETGALEKNIWCKEKLKHFSINQMETMYLSVSDTGHYEDIAEIATFDSDAYSYKFNVKDIVFGGFRENENSFLIATNKAISEYTYNTDLTQVDRKDIFKIARFEMIDKLLLIGNSMLIVTGGSYSETEDVLILDLDTLSASAFAKQDQPRLNCAVKLSFGEVALLGYGTMDLSMAFIVSGLGFAGTHKIGRNEILAWNVCEKKRIKEFPGHEGPVWDVVIPPHGRYFASCSEDETIRIWDYDCDEASFEEKVICDMDEEIRDIVVEADRVLLNKTKAAMYAEMPDKNGDFIMTNVNDGTREGYVAIDVTIENFRDYLNCAKLSVAIQKEDYPQIGEIQDAGSDTAVILKNGEKLYYPQRLKPHQISHTRRLIAGIDNYTLHVIKLD